MDRLALPAVLLGLGVILLALWLEGGQLASLLNGPALLIVVGGSLVATLAQCPWGRFQRWLTLCRWLASPPRQDLDGLSDNLQFWSQQCRNQGLLALEEVSDDYPDPFVRKGLQLLVDGAPPEQLRDLLESDLYLQQDGDYKAADIFQMMGGYAPTMGILGAVLGLIQAMGQLTNPEALGSGIATAFVATIYGVAFANLIFLPLGGRLHAIIDARSRYQEAAIVGLMSLGLGEHPAKVAMKLQSYQDH
ncbi:flagellar motor protein [Gallaecimonas kandeliae]|uniref:flagellar motor protein n=1 Tax=Gallaecimonas kandeliae TaxID=3029055 RepID=UPI0026498526|nr:flagellar motor protein [Gallaecimonas kandeliae]WKE66760.1 flagellar motor protein [Gallaecimonas kandeliae]